MPTFYQANVTATNGSALVTVNSSGDDIGILRERSFLQIGTNRIVEVKRGIAGSPAQIELAVAWPFSTVTADAIAGPTAGDLAEAVEQIRSLNSQAADILADALIKSDNLAGLASKSAARGNLGLGNVATLTYTESATDNTSGRVPIIRANGGIYGLGSEGTNTLDADFNTLPEVVGRTHLPIHLSNTGSTNGPPRGTYYYVQHIFHSGSQANCIQIAWPYRNSAGSERGIFYRTRFSEVWSDWSEIFNTTNILGTVLPPDDSLTSAIIERGSNASGEYVKFADGTLICTRDYSATIDVDIASGGLYRSAAVTVPLPVNFISGERTQPSGGSLVDGVWSVPSSSSSSSFTFRCFAAQSTVGASVDIKLFAIGRCF